MQKKENKTLTRADYEVPMGEEKVVHYTAEKVLFDGKSGERVSHPDLIKTDVKMFDAVKRNLELHGYTINILYHPLGKYPEEVVTESALERKSREIEEKDAEIAELRALLEKQNATEKTEAVECIAPEKTEAKSKGRPKKE